MTVKRAAGIGLSLAASLAVAAATGAAQQVGEIEKRERVFLGRDTTGSEIWLRRQAGELGRQPRVEKGLILMDGDTLGLTYPWVLKVELVQGRRDEGRVALAADPQALPGKRIMPTQGDSAEFIVESLDRGRSRIHLRRGALFLTDWRAEDVCWKAEEGCVSTNGTAFLLYVTDDPGGRDSARAFLAVTEDEVEILWWGEAARASVGESELRERARSRDCDGTSSPCRQPVSAGTESIWSWTTSEPPEPWDERVRAAVGVETLEILYADLAEAVRKDGSDIWKDSIFEKPLFWVATGGVLGGIACIIWCGGDDVTGNVIINP